MRCCRRRRPLFLERGCLAPEAQPSRERFCHASLHSRSFCGVPRVRLGWPARPGGPEGVVSPQDQPRGFLLPRWRWSLLPGRRPSSCCCCLEKSHSDHSHHFLMDSHTPISHSHLPAYLPNQVFPFVRFLDASCSAGEGGAGVGGWLSR